MNTAPVVSPGPQTWACPGALSAEVSQPEAPIVSLYHVAQTQPWADTQRHLEREGGRRREGDPFLQTSTVTHIFNFT